MSKISVSITCGNPRPKSRGSVSNVDHNNRKNLTSKAEKRINLELTEKNITFIKQDISDCYEELFSQAVSEYDALQKQPCRRFGSAETYLKKLTESKKEKPYYEAIIQFGDKETCGVDGKNGTVTTKMLEKYMRDFQKRNPNLKVFNAVLHLDESTPHIHLDYVPWCENFGKNGLSVKNSLTQALAQQGFHAPKKAGEKLSAEAKKSGQLASWLAAEKEIMSEILQDFGFEIDEKNEHRTHLSVDEFQKAKDEKSAFELDKNALAQENLNLKNQLREKENERKKSELKLNVSEKIRRSEAVEIDISDEDKVGAVVEKLADFNIAATPTRAGVVVPNFAETLAKKVLNEYKPAPNFAKLRDILKFDIDKFCLYANDFEGFVKLLENANYEVKRGKYFAVKPPEGERFLRTYKLGEGYSEEQISERILHRHDFIDECKKCVSQTQNLEKDFYGCLANAAILIVRNKIPPKVFARKISYTIVNDRRICELNDLLKIVQNEGLTRENLWEKMLALTKRQDDLRGEIQRNIDLKTRAIKITSQVSIVKTALDWDKKVADTAKEKLARVGVKSFEDLENLRDTSVFDKRILELEREIEGEKLAYCSYLKIAEIVEDLKNGHLSWAENFQNKENGLEISTYKEFEFDD